MKNRDLQSHSTYLEGMADGLIVQGLGPPGARLKDIAQILRELAPHVCGQGYVCGGGPDCDFDHK